MDPLLLDIPTEFSSERLFFRSYRLGDRSMYFEMLRVNWEHLYEFMPQNLVDVLWYGMLLSDWQNYLVVQRETKGKQTR